MKKLLGLAWEKFCNLMIGYDNLTGKLVYADKLFTRKPQSLGEGLARIKKKFGAVGQLNPLMSDSRRYVAKDGSYVHFHNNHFSNNSALHIHKEVQPVSAAEYNKMFAYKPAEISKNYINTNLGDEVLVDRAIEVRYFKPLKLKDIRSNSIATHNIDRPGVQELRHNNFYRDYYHNTKFIPYEKAVARGMKI